MTVILFVAGATVTMRRYRRCGELIEPKGQHRPDTFRLEPGRWAMDNGAFSGFEVEPYVAMLDAFFGRTGCRFVTAPDVVGDAAETLRRWRPWSRVIRGFGFPPALVAQDGMTVADVPWTDIAALFIGGHTEWKLGPQAEALISYAKARGLWVHMGRVNSIKRIGEAARKGCDSFDGSQHSWFPDKMIPFSLGGIDAVDAQRRLSW